MRILSIVGKVDTRSIVYPLARALCLDGNTGIITDDGAYRRLYHGKGNLGNVSGIDICIVTNVNDETIHSLDDSGIGYDNLILVSSDYLCPSATGYLICHGIDRSMLAVESDDDDDDFIFAMPVVDVNKDADSSKNSSKKTNSKKNKDNKSDDNSVNTENEDAVISSECDNYDSDIDNNQEVEETIHDKVIRLQKENPDKIIIPDIANYTEVQIAFAAAPKRGMAGISLKEGILNYIYNCEETKEFTPIADKTYNTNLAKMLAKPLDMNPNDLFNLLSREEGTGKMAGKKK